MLTNEVQMKGKQKVTATLNNQNSWVHLNCPITSFFTNFKSNFKVIITLVQEMEVTDLSLLLVSVVFGSQVL